jgi:hypothetical protein
MTWRRDHCMPCGILDQITHRSELDEVERHNLPLIIKAIFKTTPTSGKVQKLMKQIADLLSKN